MPAPSDVHDAPPSPAKLNPVTPAPTGESPEVKGLELQLKGSEQDTSLLIEAPTQLRGQKRGKKGVRMN